MGTAVFLHPQDWGLIAPHHDRNLRFLGASECPYSVARPCRRSYSASPEALAPFRDHGRSFTPSFMECRKQILDQMRFLGHKEAAAGLLPVPPKVVQSACASTFHRCPSVPRLDSSDGLKHGCRRWTGIADQKIEYRRMQPEKARVQTHLCQKVLPASKTELICTNTTVPRRKHGMGKQLKWSASEKRQEVRESPSLQRPGTEEAIKKLMANPSEDVLLCCNGNPTRGGSAADRKTEDSQASWDANCHGRTGVVETGAPRSMQKTVCQEVVEIGGTERNVAASLQAKGDGSVNASRQCEEKIKGDKISVVAGFLTQGHNACTGNVEKNSSHDSHLAPSKPKPMAGSKLISRSFNSIIRSDDGMWVSAVHDERWAGPSFSNSPSPSSLPVPSFTVKFSRSASTGSKAAKCAAYVAPITSSNSCFQDVEFATNDLRRMLNLDHGSGDL